MTDFSFLGELSL